MTDTERCAACIVGDHEGHTCDAFRECAFERCDKTGDALVRRDFDGIVFFAHSGCVRRVLMQIEKGNS